jgi:hypothetical protein
MRKVPVMNSMMTRTIGRKLLLLFACSVVAAILVSYEFGRGSLSPRGLGIALLALLIAIGIVLVLIIRSAKGFTAPLGQPETSIDPANHKRLFWLIRMAQARVATMAVVVVLGLTQIRDFPVWALLVGVAISLAITAKSVQTVVRLRKILAGKAQAGGRHLPTTRGPQ